MPSTLLQSYTGLGAGSTTVTATPSSNLTAGSFLVMVFAAANLAVNAVTSVTDTASNTWTKRLAGAGAFSESEIWTAPNTSGGMPTVTATVGTSQNLAVRILEISNALGYDTGHVGTDSGNYIQSHSAGPTATTTVPDSFVIFSYTPNNGTPGLTHPAGFTGLPGMAVGSGNYLDVSYKNINTVGAQSATATTTQYTNGVPIITVISDGGGMSSPLLPSNAIRPHLFSPGIAR